MNPILRLFAMVHLLGLGSSAFLSPITPMAHKSHPICMETRAEESGAIPPTGYFDPLGFMRDGDEEVSGERGNSSSMRV